MRQSRTCDHGAVIGVAELLAPAPHGAVASTPQGPLGLVDGTRGSFDRATLEPVGLATGKTPGTYSTLRYPVRVL